MDKLNFGNLKRGISYKGKWKDSGFVAFPKKMFFDPRLSANHLKVAGILEIHAFAGKKECYPSIRTMEKETGLSRPTIIQAIKDLKSFGFLETDKSKGRSTHYFIKFW